jgi:ubiquinone/menaquinone biosynthesis C-methylase UbiE
MQFSESDVVKANIKYHQALADTYNETQPNFRPENVARVDSIIKNLVSNIKGISLLDIGCGTGFIIDIAKKYFDRVVGVDITREMLNRVDVSSGNVELYLGDVSKLPFTDASFDVCTAYGFLHHLPDLHSSFSEVFRCLKPGGLFYADQDPNFYFWELIKSLLFDDVKEPIVKREITAVLDVSQELIKTFDLDEKTIALAEYQKIVRGGMKAEEITKVLLEIGYSSIDFEYQWFLGQGYVINTISQEAAQIIDNHLKKCLPATKALFKYFSFIAHKG